MHDTHYETVYNIGSFLFCVLIVFICYTTVSETNLNKEHVRKIDHDKCLTTRFEQSQVYTLQLSTA